LLKNKDKSQITFSKGVTNSNIIKKKFVFKNFKVLLNFEEYLLVIKPEPFYFFKYTSHSCLTEAREQLQVV